ncbi:MAG: pilus assembly PilX family protein [Coriobacteriia bacterium]
MLTKMRRAGARSDDSGVAMVTVIGIMVVVSVLAIGAFTLARQSLHEAARTSDETRAFRAAAAGLDIALATFNPDTLHSIEGTTSEGSYKVSVSSAGNEGEFKLVSDGVGKDGGKERLIQRFYYFNLWKMNFAGIGPQSLITGTSGLNGSSHILGPFYMKGNLEIDSNMSVREGPLFVKGGNITVSGSGQLGESLAPIRVYCDRDVGGKESNIHIASRSVSVPDINLPKLTYEQMLAWSTAAQQESGDGRMGTATGASPDTRLENLEKVSQPTTYKYFGAGSGIAAMGQGTHALTLGHTTFGAWGSINTTGAVISSPRAPYTASDVNRYDDFAYWNGYTTGWDLMFINGTVFVDGPLTIADNVLYIGNGTIVANGDIRIDGLLRPFGADNTVGEQNRWALGLVTPKNLTITATSGNSNSNTSAEVLRAALPDLAGAFYADGVVAVTGNNMHIRGSILAGRMDMGRNNTKLVTNPLLPEYLPQALPGAQRGLLIPGNWSRE